MPELGISKVVMKSVESSHRINHCEGERERNKRAREKGVVDKSADYTRFRAHDGSSEVLVNGNY